MIPKLDVDTYRQVRADLEEARESIKQLEEKKKELEQGIFGSLDVGDKVVFDEFEFIVSEGRRGFYPSNGFEIRWNTLIFDSKWEGDGVDVCGMQTELADLVVEKVSYKGPTLAKMEKMLTENNFVREHWDTIKEILGYKEGSRVEKVKEIEQDVITDPVGDQGRYCFSKVNGTSFRPVPWDKIRDGDELSLEREPGNKYDENAIKVIWSETHIGYIPKNTAVSLAQLMDKSPLKFYAIITEITGGPKNGTTNEGINISVNYKKLE